MQPQGVEAQGIFRVEDSPLGIGNILDYLKPDFVSGREALFGHVASRPLRPCGTDISGFEKRPEGTLHGNRVLGDVGAIARQHATEVLRPGSIQRWLTMTRPTFLARSSSGCGGKAMKASTFRSRKYSLLELRAAFNSTNENRSSEWTLQLRCIADVQRLWTLVAIE
jgi:hypothetical protein